MNKKNASIQSLSDDTAETSGLQKFFSLKWKAIILTSIVLIIVNVFLSSTSYMNLQKQFDDQEELTYHRYNREIEALISQSLQHMKQVASMISVLTYTEAGEDTVDTENLKRTLELYWPALQLSMGIDTIRFYGLENQLLVDWGRTCFRKDITELTPTWISEINRLEQPMTLIDCTEGCIQYAATPVLCKGKKAGVILVGSSLADIVLGFRQMSGIDMGIITLDESQDNTDVGPMTLPSWKSSVIALTNKAQNMPVLKKLASEYPEVRHVISGIRTSDAKRCLKVALIPFENFNIEFKGNGFLVLIADITRSVFEIKSALKQTVWVCVIGFLFSEILLLFLLWKPLSRLRRTALHLPLLAENKFREAREAIHAEYRNRERKDEVDVLVDTTTTLSYQLENLAQTIADHIDELSHERDFVKSLLDTAQVIIIMQNRFGEITLLNHYGCLLTMYDAGDLVGKKFEDLLPTSERGSDLEEKLTQILSGELEQFSHEILVLCKDGSTKPIAWNHCLLSGKSVKDPLVLSVGLDITTRKKAELELRKREEHLQAVFRAADSVSFITTDIDGTGPKIIDFSLGAERIFGYERKDAIGKPLAMLYLPEDAGSIAGACESIQEKKGGTTAHLNLVRESGEKFPALSTTYPILDADGNMTLALWVSFDISEITEAYKQKENLESQLVQSQKMQAIGTLAGGIAHDFNNILFPIMGYVEMSINDLPEDSKVRSNLEKVLKATNRAKEMVQQILAFSRRSEQERKPLKIQSIIKEALKLLRASIPSTIEISQNIDKECGAVLADPIQIHQVMMNLCTNAYHAMREKGGLLGIALTEVNIHSGDLASHPELKPGPHVRLTVSDTGHGMDRVVMERIFDPYFTTKGPGEGTGMGLSVAHGIVRSHGGHIAVYSEPGKGTIFNVYLPRIDTTATAPETVSPEPAPKGKERLLLVDDEEQIIHMMRQMLERLGYDVTTQISSVEALKAFRHQPEKFDLVITDQTMPKLTGVQLAQKLMSIRPDIPIILCTGFSEVVSEDEAKAIGIREFLMKPVVMAELAEVSRKALGKNRG